jgi:hypothetical protein
MNQNCANCGTRLSESEAAFGVRLCAACSAQQASLAPKVEQDNFIQRSILTAGVIGAVLGFGGGEVTEAGATGDAAHNGGEIDAGGFDAGGGAVGGD